MNKASGKIFSEDGWELSEENKWGNVWRLNKKVLSLYHNLKVKK